MGRSKKRIRLQVCMQDSLVGFLDRDSSGAVSFSYSESWLQRRGAMPISMSLPLGAEKFSGRDVHDYFDNLLPDSLTVRKRIATRIGVQRVELLNLLSALGRDCIGALQFIPDGSALPGAVPEVEGEQLSRKKIGTILKDLTLNPLGLERDKEFRISVAGVQEKTALLRIGKKWHRPKGTVPTSHIIKKSLGHLFNGIDMSESVHNEWLCLSICQKLGLETANATIEEFGDVTALVVERFDRVWSDDKKKLYRLPTEDLCQALGISSSMKYENEGGPGIKQIMNLLGTSNLRERDRKTFMKAQVIFYLLGAIDGHAKNFSIFLGPQGMRLTPLYDVLTAFPALVKRQIEVKELKLAMAIGKNRKYRIREIQRRHWYESAELVRFGKANMDEIFAEIETDLDNLNFDSSEMPRNFPESLLEATLSGIERFKRQLYR